MWKLLEIISCCNIVFTWEHGQYWSKIFHKNRKIARRENRRMAFESDSYLFDLRLESKEIFEREGGEDGPTMVPTSEISDVISNPFPRYFINVASDVSTKE